MKKLKNAFIVLLMLLIFYGITGFFIVPPVVKSLVSKNLSQTLHRSVSIEQVRFNPFTLLLQMKGIFISDIDKKSKFVSIKDLVIDLDIMSVFKQSLILSELMIDGPTIQFVRFPDNTYSFSDLIKGEKKKKNPFFFSLANIQINNGRVVMKDLPVNRTHTASDIAVILPFISNMAYYSNVFVQPHFQAVINGTSFILKGKTKPFSESLETTLTLNLKGINIPYYLSYLPSKQDFTVNSGSLDLDATGRYIQFRDKRKPEFTLSGMLIFRDFALSDGNGKPMIQIPLLSASLAPSEILKKKVHVRKVSVTSPAIILVRDQKKVFNIQSSFAAEDTVQDREKPKAGPAVRLSLDEVLLDGGRITFSDLSGSLPVNLTIDAISSHAGNITTEKEGRGIIDLSCIINKTGKMNVKSSFTVTPPSIDARFDLAGLEPSWVQPYIMNTIPVLLRRGSLNAAGHVVSSVSQGKTPVLNIVGDMQLVDFASVDRERMQDLVSWKNLTVSGMDFSLKPARLSIREIELMSPAARVSINQTGKSNIDAFFGKKAASQPARVKGQKSEPLKISLGKIIMKNGRFAFMDKSVSPNFSTALTGVQGNISGLSTDEFKKANVFVTARIDNQAPVSITGSVNPLKKDLFVDLTARMANIELTSMSAYSGKYLGYTIEKGKLSLNLKYLISQKQLESENNVFIDQFTFGDAVESEKATKLPVRLAVLLLRDKEGKIDLHLPVTGRTDDPQFRVGKIILQMIVNVFEKAATSPFALLEAFYPGAAELSAIEFSPGRSSLNENAKQRLEKLVKILTDRPSLKVELKGYADPPNDRPGLVNTLFERKLKAQKLKDVLKRGKQASSVDDVVIGPEEYSNYLKKAYKAETFKKPTIIMGIAKSLPDEEMKRLIMGHITVNDDDLNVLASERSRNIRDYLVDTGKMDAERIFILDAGALHPEKIANVRDSRVGLTIK